MTIKTYKRSELRDIMDKRERAARKYLRKKEETQPTGIIREIIAGIAFVILTAAILVIGLAL